MQKFPGELRGLSGERRNFWGNALFFRETHSPGRGTHYFSGKRIPPEGERIIFQGNAFPREGHAFPCVPLPSCRSAGRDDADPFQWRRRHHFFCAAADGANEHDAGGVLGPSTTVTVTKAKKVTISGLTLAGIYQFHIRALGVLGYTDWMDTKTFVVA